MGNCKLCGARAESEYCFRHKPKKALKSTGKLRSKAKSKEQVEKEKEDTERMWNLFLEIWEERGPYSEVSGERIFGEPLSIYFHHILPKSKFPEQAYNKENIILLSWIEHDNVEVDPYRYEEINKRREKLLSL